jgi:hypothetical protein
VPAPEKDDRGVAGHFVRSLGESTRHNSLAYGYSLALTCSFGVLAVLDRPLTVVDVFLFGIGGSIPFSLANPSVTRGFQYRVEGEPPIVLALGASFGFLSITVAVAAAALAGWVLSSWSAWLVGGFAGSAVYLLATALELVFARVVRALLGRDHLRER